MTYLAKIILSQDEWEMVCPIGTYPTHSSAEQALNGIHASFEEHDRIACIRVIVENQTINLMDDDVTISELSESAQQRLGPPLDMSNPSEVELAIEALQNHDPAYKIEPSNKKLKDFLIRFGRGYRPDHVANGIVQIF